MARGFRNVAGGVILYNSRMYSATALCIILVHLTHTHLISITNFPRLPFLPVLPLFYNRLEKNANALQKEAKAYLDSIRSVTASSTRIATTIDLFFGSDAGEQAMAANAYRRAVEEMEGSVARSIVSFISECFGFAEEQRS